MNRGIRVLQTHALPLGYGAILEGGKTASQSASNIIPVNDYPVKSFFGVFKPCAALFLIPF